MKKKHTTSKIFAERIRTQEDNFIKEGRPFNEMTEEKNEPQFSMKNIENLPSDMLILSEITGEDGARSLFEEGGHGSIHEDEPDAELFNIFLRDLKEKLFFIKHLMSDLCSAENRVDILEKCINCIKRLRSSANYMDYKQLVLFYDSWVNEIEDFSTGLFFGKEHTISDFIKSGMEAKIGKIFDFFCDCEELQPETNAIEEPSNQNDALLFTELNTKVEKKGTEPFESRGVIGKQEVHPDHMKTGIQPKKVVKQTISVDVGEIHFLMNQVRKLIITGGTFSRLSAEMLEFQDNILAGGKVNSEEFKCFKAFKSRINETMISLKEISNGLQDIAMKT